MDNKKFQKKNLARIRTCNDKIVKKGKWKVQRANFIEEKNIYSKKVLKQITQSKKNDRKNRICKKSKFGIKKTKNITE